jgi:uncharacterized repeat protein (TIGR03843 family)
MIDINSKEILGLIKSGRLEVKGEFLWGSNYTVLAQVIHQKISIPVVYKPSKGERPLWDFPRASLAKREVAAFLVSDALGWHLVPPTIYRDDAPLGPGSVQLFIEHDPEYHYFCMTAQEKRNLKPVVLFDYLINNGDRNGGHVIFGPDMNLWLIDHGVTFHVEDKLRTVIWDFAGETIPGKLITDLKQFMDMLDVTEDAQESLGSRLGQYLSSSEILALRDRTSRLISTSEFPTPNPHRRHYPWPQI